MSKPIAKRIGELERQSGVGGNNYVLRIKIWPREIRWLMRDDGDKGEPIRVLEYGELIPECMLPWEDYSVNEEAKAMEAAR